MAAPILIALIALFAGLLYYVYDGYLRLLRIIARITRRTGHVTDAAQRTDDELPSIAVLVAVHNEAHQIVERVQDILDQEYPRELLDIVLASDRSTDGLDTVLTEHFGEHLTGGVRIVHSEHRVGKSSVQNQAIETIRASIVLFSDADTRFAPGFLRAVVAPFSNASVGAVQAHLLFVPAEADAGPVAQARYWSAELEIRQLEANLGILAVASGACIAVRRDLWRPLDPTLGEDCMIPLDVVAQSKTVAYADQAIAYEPADPEFGNVVSTRARMTVRNWQGTWSRRALLDPFSNPGYAFALWSHKLLRWLSPIWLLGLTICAIALAAVSSGTVLRLPAAAIVALSLLATIGGLAQRRSRRVPICTTIYSFFLANLGFLSGLVKAARGVTISGYR